MKSNVGRLSLMMFLQYAVWGAWLPLAARYLTASTAEGGLGFTGTQMGTILGLAGSIGAIAGPFIAGQLADRYFSTERFLAALLATGGVVKWITATQHSFQAWLWLSILYSVVYMPTLALSNSMAFANLGDRDRGFPKVRVWGTIGWIAASWIFPMIYLQTGLHLQAMPPFLVGPELPNVTSRLADSLRFSALISWGYALFCFALPHTPPKKDAVEKLAFKKAFGLLSERSFLVLVLASLPISVIHQVYFLQTPPFLSHLGLADSQIGPAMTIGQFSEIGIMALLGGMLARLGFRTVITIGAVAYFVRYFIWSITSLPVALLVSSQVLHGICYACFFAGAYIYTDRVAPADVRHSAQTVFGIIILGGGPVLGGLLSGWLADTYAQTGGVVDYGALWRVVSLIGLAAAVFFWTMFRERESHHSGLIKPLSPGRHPIDVSAFVLAPGLQLAGSAASRAAPVSDAVARAQAGDPDAFESLYRTHVGRVHALSLRLTGDSLAASDLTQDTFVRAWEALDSFRGDSAFGSWLFRLAVNVFLGDQRKAVRRERRVFAVSEPGLLERPGEAGGSGATLDLDKAIAALPGRARMVFVLHDVEGYQHAEIATMTGVAEGTSKAQLFRARRLLREALER